MNPSKDLWETPNYLFNSLNQIFNLDLDAAANSKNKKLKRYLGPGGIRGDALAVEWDRFGKRIFVNPPYSNENGPLRKWVGRMFMATEAQSLVVAILPATTNVGWFHDFVMGSAAVFFPRSRIRFNHPGKPPGSARHDSMIVVWGILPAEMKGVWL